MAPLIVIQETSNKYTSTYKDDNMRPYQGRRKHGSRTRPKKNTDCIKEEKKKSRESKEKEDQPS
jgi:hypothetical protein